MLWALDFFFVEMKADKNVVHAKPFPTDTDHTDFGKKKKKIC